VCFFEFPTGFKPSTKENPIIFIQFSGFFSLKSFLAPLLAVRDTGAGIAEENLGKIFEPLFTIKPFGEGTDLGLAIVYELVNDSGGNIVMESVPGNTVFRIMFPFKEKG
jgi:nitrogen-specific signal transduction histidine kinase